MGVTSYVEPMLHVGWQLGEWFLYGYGTYTSDWDHLYQARDFRRETTGDRGGRKWRPRNPSYVGICQNLVPLQFTSK